MLGFEYSMLNYKEHAREEIIEEEKVPRRWFS